MSEKIRYPLEVAEPVAILWLQALGPFVHRIVVAGSIRRRKSTVGDIEILLVPRFDESLTNGELFATRQNLFNVEINRLVNNGLLSFRPKSDGSIANGEEIKLMRCTRSGIPIDFFITTETNWYSSLVCRTGGKESNTLLASMAKRRGLHWKMNGPGFVEDATGRIIPICKEEDAFTLLGLQYRQPEERSV